jgi:hypothetical protein
MIMPMLSSKKFIEIIFCVGCMVSQPNRLFQPWTTMSLINKKKYDVLYSSSSFLQ